MTHYFINNLLLAKDLSDEQYSDIPSPRFELHVHVLYKTVQAGSILGMVVFGPLVGLVRGRSWTAVKAAALKGGRIGAMIGVPMGPLMTEMTLSKAKATPESIFDRCYRIRHNIGQVRTDRFCTIGSVVGTGVGVALGAGAFNGFVVGVVGSTLSAGVYNNFINPPPKKSKEKEEEETEDKQ